MSEVLLETMLLGPQLKLPISFISTEATTVTCLIEKMHTHSIMESGLFLLVATLPKQINFSFQGRNNQEPFQRIPHSNSPQNILQTMVSFSGFHIMNTFSN